MMFVGDQLYRIENTYRKSLGILDNQLKEIMQNGWSYIKDSNDFIKKIKHLKNIPDNALF